MTRSSLRRGPRYRITLVPLPGEPPAAARLKGALKFLLRRFRLRCASIEKLEP